MISKREIRKIMKQHLGDKKIKEELVECILADCEAYVDAICKTIVYKFNERNQIRRMGGLREFKILSLCEYKKLLTRLYKTDLDFNIGEVGNTSTKATTTLHKVI